MHPLKRLALGYIGLIGLRVNKGCMVPFPEKKTSVKSSFGCYRGYMLCTLCGFKGIGVLHAEDSPGTVMKFSIRLLLFMIRVSGCTAAASNY